jgi:FkbM family methyltransferase
MNLLQRIARSDSPKLQRPFRAFVGYMLQGTGFSDRIQLKRSQYTVPFFGRSNVALTLWVNPNVVDRAEEFVYDYLSEGATLVDIGANIGCVTAAGSLAVGSDGQVYAIEPHPRTFSHLQKTVAVNHCDNVICLNVAAGATAGVVQFTDEKRKDDNNRVSLQATQGIEVPCVTLNSLVQEHRIARIDLLKIDVEGFEMRVLEGAADILDRVGCIYIEVLDHNLRKFGSSASELIRFLTQRGFACYQFRDDASNVVAFAHGVPSKEWQAELIPVSMTTT